MSSLSFNSPLQSSPPLPSLNPLPHPIPLSSHSLHSSPAHSPTDSDSDDMASLYRQYHRSPSPSLSPHPSHDQHPHPDSSGERSFVAGDDATGFPSVSAFPSTACPSAPPRPTAVLDELNELLGEAIHQAHSHTFLPPSHSSSHSSLHNSVSQTVYSERDQSSDHCSPLYHPAPSLPSSASDYSDGSREGTEAAPQMLPIHVPHQAEPTGDVSVPHSSMSISPLSPPSPLPSSPPQHPVPQTPGSPYDIRTYPQHLSLGLIDTTPASSPRQLLESRTRKATLTPRSPVVRRDSEDLNFLDQWQWLEAQFPGDPPSVLRKDKFVASPPALPKPAPVAVGVPDRRQKLVGALDAHFVARREEAIRKRRLLEQRQQMLGAARIVAGRPTRVVGRWCEGVPSLNMQEVRRLKAGSERCRLYGAALGQLVGHETGLDMWVWLKTRASKGETVRPARRSTVPAPRLVLPPHMQVAGHDHLRDASLSSVATFPLRTNAHKAIQIGTGASGELVELVMPDQPEGQQQRQRQRPNGMVVNALMEVRNLPFPGLYPHSAGPSKTSYAHPHSPIPPPMTADVGGGYQMNQQQEHQARGNRFFNSIGRRNSTKRTGAVVVNSGSAVGATGALGGGSGKSGLMISGPLSGAVLNGPRGPRPESMGKRMGVGYGNRHGIEQRRGGRMGAGSTPPGTVVGMGESEGVEGGKVQRRSFAYGSGGGGEKGAGGGNGQQGVGEIVGVGSMSQSMGMQSTMTHPNTNSKKMNIGRGKRGMNKKEEMEEEDYKVDVKGEEEQGRWKEQVEKMIDILPFADRKLVYEVLEKVGGDEVAAIGLYLQIDKTGIK